MKLIAAAGAAALIALAALIAVPMSVRYDGIETDRELEHFKFLHSQGTEVRGLSDGSETVLTAGNLARVVSLISITERRRVMFPPKEPETAGAVISVGGEATLRIAEAPRENGKDMALVYYEYGAKKRCYSINGYNLLKNVTAAISPEGFSGENITP